MAYTIQGGVSKQVWTQNALNFNIMLQIAGADIQIQDLDIDFDVYKNNKSEANKSTITIWNLNDTTYQRILEKTYAADIYTWYGNDEPALLFRGYVDPEKTVKRNNSVRGFLNSPIKRDNKNSSDIPTIIELIDGKAAYTDSMINKNYREKVSSTQIIKDCIEAMGVGIAKFSDNLPAVEYNTYKAVGRPHIVLQKICKSLNIRFCIINDLIQVIAPEEQFSGEFAILLTPENSMRPERLGENELSISTRFIPFINPNDWVQCNFKEFEGIEAVRQVHHKGNNYGTAGETEIIIGFDKLKKKRGRKRKKSKAKNENL